MKTTIGIAVASSMLLVGCLSSNESTQVQVQFGLSSPATMARSVQYAVDTQLTLTYAKAHLEKVTLSAQKNDCKETKTDSCQVSGKEKLSPVDIDLLDSAQILDLGETQPGNYGALKAKMRAGDDLTPGLEIHGLALNKPFRLSLNLDAELKFAAPTQIGLSAGHRLMQALLDPRDWFTAQQIEACRNDSKALFIQDTLVINSKNDCSGLHAQIKNQIQLSGRLLAK